MKESNTTPCTPGPSDTPTTQVTTEGNSLGQSVTISPPKPPEGSKIRKSEKLIVTLEPYERKKSRKYIMPGVCVPNSYNKYLHLNLNSKEIDIFETYREIIKCIGRQPKITSQNNNKLLVEVDSLEESEKLLNLTALGEVSVECSPHSSLNFSKGLIYAPELMIYSEEKLERELRDQGVLKVERMKKKINGDLVPQPNLVITFNSLSLPEMVHAAWHRYKVKQFVPRPMRCFHCQNFGHNANSCRRKDQQKPALCVNCGQDEHGICEREPECVHCGEDHPSSSNKCDVFLFEKEIQAIRVTERTTFREARMRAQSRYVRPGLTFSTVVAKCRNRLNKETKTNVLTKESRQTQKRPLSEIRCESPNIRSVRPKGNLAEMNAKNDFCAEPMSEETSCLFKEVAPTGVGASSSLEIGAADVSVPAVAGTSASLEAGAVGVTLVPAAPGASASSENGAADGTPVPAAAGTSASLEARVADVTPVPANAGTATSLEVEIVAADQPVAKEPEKKASLTTSSASGSTRKEDGFWKVQKPYNKPKGKIAPPVSSVRRNNLKVVKGNLNRKAPKI